MVVEEVMTPEAVVVGPGASVHQVLGVMLDEGVRHVPVVQDGELVGIVSDRDLRSFWNPDALAHFEQSTELMSQPVGTLMSGGVVSVTPETELADVVDVMLEQNIGAVPVVRRGELVGVVSYVDILRVAKDSL